VSAPPRTPAETLPTVFEKGPRVTPPHHHEVGELAAGALIGEYRIVRHLGSGGMGSVYEAVHVDIGKTVALKLLSRDLASDPRARARFLREALAASRLVHPHVVNVTDVGDEGDLLFLVMELLRGEDLASCINRQPRGLPIEEAVDILLAVSAGVFAAHQAGVVHRDLKPRNIFLNRTTVKKEVEPKVLDFGISKLEGGAAGNSLTESGALLGTVPYLSPEHVKGGTTDARSDQYALGVVLFECITGRYPHEGHTPYAVMQNIAEGRFFAPSAFRHDVPAQLEGAIGRAMSTDPAARFASVHELGRALLPFASAHGQLIWGEYFGAAGEGPGAGASTRTALVASPVQIIDRDPPRGVSTPAPGSSTPPRGPGTTVGSQRPAVVRPRLQGFLTVVTVVFAFGAGAWLMSWMTGSGPPWSRLRTWLGEASPTAEVAAHPSPPPVAVARSRPEDSPAPSHMQQVEAAKASLPAPISPTAVPARTSSPASAPAAAGVRATSLPPSGRPQAGFDPTAAEAPTPAEAAPAAGASAPGAPASAPAPAAAPEAEVAPPGASTVNIQVVSQPTGATVWLDKEVQPRGRTPLRLTLPAGHQGRSVILRLRGHEARVLSLVPSESRTLDVALAKTSPRAHMRTRRPGVRRSGNAQPPTPEDASEDAADDWSEKLLD
jgi:hypothetical protein